MDCVDCFHRDFVSQRDYRQNRAVSDFRTFLCLRSDLCADLVSLPFDDENTVLHNLQNFQLGSPDDVFASDFCWRVLRRLSGSHVFIGLGCMGALYSDSSGAFLGA